MGDLIVLVLSDAVLVLVLSNAVLVLVLSNAVLVLVLDRLLGRTSVEYEYENRTTS